MENSYRSIFKWGDPGEYKHPNNQLYEELKTTFNLTDSDFDKKIKDGNDKVKCNKKPKLSKTQINTFAKIVGHDNISLLGFDRVKYSNGKTMEEAITLRDGDNGVISDLVVHPRNKIDVQKIVKYCNSEKIAIYVYGGGSSVTLGLKPTKGGITLVMNTHMNNILEFNEINQTVTVQPGMMGPEYEEALNSAPETFNAKRKYTGGHFPQSFEYSSVGGWVVTLGSGQQSTYYGDAYDIVLSQEYITPRGTIKSLDFPATATGPKINDIMKGSEGSFGILVELKMKIFRYMPENRQRFAFIFPTWESAVDASKEISQGEFGAPAVFRISDQEETHIGLKLYGIDGTILDTFMRLRGFKPMKRCLMLASSEGEKNFAKNIKKKAIKICKQYGGMYLTEYPTKKWEHGRYKDPYMREDLHDYGLVIDTLEAGVTWDNIHNLHQGVRKFIKKRTGTICMTHASHFYPQGTNLYFIFILKLKSLKDYKKFHEGIVDAINNHGGSLSHHHGAGKLMGPWMEKHLGKEEFEVLKALKKHFDPKNIMNPGGQMGLDIKQKK